MRRLRVPYLRLTALTVVWACAGYDGDYIPYALRGFDVWFHDDRPSCDEVDDDDEDDAGLPCRRGDAEVYLGRVEAN